MVPAARPVLTLGPRTAHALGALAHQTDPRPLAHARPPAPPPTRPEPRPASTARQPAAPVNNTDRGAPAQPPVSGGLCGSPPQRRPR